MANRSKNKPTFDEYPTWLKDKLKIELSDSDRKHYETVQVNIKHEFENSNCWKDLNKEFPIYSDEYFSEHRGFNLFSRVEIPELQLKPYGSFFNKTYRKNILENKNWPKPPGSGWIIPANWYSRINDIVRTVLVVKYLDGVRFLAAKMCEFCEKNKIRFERPSFEHKETGYYAAHFYILREYELPDLKFDTINIVTAVEIQVTSQLQETIRALLHKYYDRRRMLVEKEPIEWQWDYKCDEFAANYLGHILHYVEGRIMEIREKQEEKR